VQILPFRGRNIFYRNRLSDVGALQFYGIGLENIVSENELTRMAGIVSWGQWRGVVPPPPPPTQSAGVDSYGAAPVPVTGEMGCGANPNLFGVFERNVFKEGNTVVNYNTPEGSNYNFGGGYVLASTMGGGGSDATQLGFEQLSMNSFSVFRENLIQSNGGILITDDSAHVLVEGDTIRRSELDAQRGRARQRCAERVLQDRRRLRKHCRRILSQASGVAAPSYGLVELEMPIYARLRAAPARHGRRPFQHRAAGLRVRLRDGH